MDIRDLSDQVEQVSRGYASRFRITRDSNWHLLKLHEELGELTQAHLMLTGQARTKGRDADEIERLFRSEVADVLSHVLLLARHHDIDVVDEIRRKWLVWLPPSAPENVDAPEM